MLERNRCTECDRRRCVYSIIRPRSSPRRRHDDMAKKAKPAKAADSEANSEKIKRDKKKDRRPRKKAHHGLSGAALVNSSKVVYDGPAIPRGAGPSHRARRQAEHARCRPPQRKRSHPRRRQFQKQEGSLDRHGAAIPPCGRPVLVGTAGRKTRSGRRCPRRAQSANSKRKPGYRAKKWKPLVKYFASPGFLGESMKVFLAEGLISGDAQPEEDETSSSAS